jgi:hypothetical protein
MEGADLVSDPAALQVWPGMAAVHQQLQQSFALVVGAAEQFRKPTILALAGAR